MEARIVDRMSARAAHPGVVGGCLGNELRGAGVIGIENLLKESIAHVCGVDVSGLTSASRLADIGVDSLASAEVLVDLEMRLGKQLPAGTLRRLEHASTIRDVAALLEGAFV